MDYMKEALKQARKARDEDEVPVGCVIVKDGKIISRGRNKREKTSNALAHAEIDAISKACKKLGSWRLEGCDMYVTLEPCPMCAGAIINSRIKTLYIGAIDPKNGAIVSRVNMFELGFTHKPEVQIDTSHTECSSILSDFFKMLRERKKELK